MTKRRLGAIGLARIALFAPLAPLYGRIAGIRANVVLFEQAFFAMVHLPYLKPFEDVNKRVSRLAANIPLIGENLSPLSFIDMPERAYVEGLLGVYELNRVDLLRDVFVWAYERSAQHYVAVRQSLGEPDKFRLRFRNELIEVVGDIVRQGLSPTVEEVTKATSNGVPSENLDDFVRMATKELRKRRRVRGQVGRKKRENGLRSGRPPRMGSVTFKPSWQEAIISLQQTVPFER